MNEMSNPDGLHNSVKLRPLPNNVEAEQALLGAIFINNNAYYAVSTFLESEHFYESVHQYIYDLTIGMIKVGKRANPITLKTFLPKDQMIGDKTLLQYLTTLAAKATTIMNAKDFGLAIYDNYVLREAIATGQNLMEGAYNVTFDNPPTKIIEEALSRLNDITSDPTKLSKNSGISSIVDKALDTMALAYEKQEINGVELPLPELTALNQGPLEAGNYYGLLGGTKEGKSSLTAMIVRAALDNGHPVLMLSYDQTGEQWVRQMAAQSLGIGANEQRKGEIEPSQYELINDYFDKMRKHTFDIIKCNQENADTLCTYAARFLKKIPNDNKKVPLIIADHAGKITPYDTRADAGKQAGAINVKLKAFAGEYELAWLTLIQRNSAGLKRDNPTPTTQDIYGGEGAIADYDCIFYIYRAEKWLNNRLKTCDDRKKIDIAVKIEEAKGKAELGLIAHRFAPEHLTKKVRFIPKLTKYESIEDYAPTFGGM